MKLNNLPEAVKLSTNLDAANALLDALNDRRCAISITVRKDPDAWVPCEIRADELPKLLPNLVTELITAITTRRQAVIDEIEKLK